MTVGEQGWNRVRRRERERGKILLIFDVGSGTDLVTVWEEDSKIP